MEPSAAQNGPVIKTCTQCGAVQQARTSICCYCNAPFHSAEEISRSAPQRGAPTEGNLALDPVWKHELARRMEAYRVRRRRLHPDTDQGALQFGALEREAAAGPAPAIAHQAAGRSFPNLQDLDSGENDPAEAAEEFAFAIGIGRRPASSRKAGGETSVHRVEIDVTQTGAGAANETTAHPDIPSQRPAGTHADSPYFPVATFSERCLAGTFDIVFLLFAYGGFLTLFGSLGGHLSFSKFSVVVYAASLGLFYVQYFALFTIFGGATPGMMLRHLQVVSFDGEAPSSRQLLQRSFGYVVSGGTFLLGFFWSLWDEDRLTWQDRISRTHLTQLDAVFAAEPLGGPGDPHGATHK